MREVTAAEANEFATRMCQQCSATIIHKTDVPYVQVLAYMLDALRVAGIMVPPGDSFLHRDAITLGPIVFMPDGLSPSETVEVVTHECQHVLQFWYGTDQAAMPHGPGIAWLYLTEPEARVRYEVEAYRAGLEVRVAMTGRVPSLAEIMTPFEQGYMLDPAMIEFTRELMTVAATTMASGIRMTGAAIKAYPVLRSIDTELVR